MDNSTLQSEGYIDTTGSLAPEYDAATAHLGAPCVTPTSARTARGAQPMRLLAPRVRPQGAVDATA